eukprot:7717034-Pyramimonas_sp.AAC.1
MYFWKHCQSASSAFLLNDSASRIALSGDTQTRSHSGHSDSLTLRLAHTQTLIRTQDTQTRSHSD